jgi:hypothetical protein
MIYNVSKVSEHRPKLEDGKTKKLLTPTSSEIMDHDSIVGSSRKFLCVTNILPRAADNLKININ